MTSEAYRVMPHSAIFLFSAVCCAGTALYGWLRRGKSGGWAFAGLMAASAVWTGAAAIEAMTVGLGRKVLWSQIEYVGLVFIGVFLLRFALAYTQQEHLLSPRTRRLLWLLPPVFLALVWSNAWHRLVWTDFSFSREAANVLVYHRGPLFWVISGATYGLAALSYGVLANACRTGEEAFRRQYVAVMLSGLFPLSTGGIYLFAQEWVYGMDVAPLGFSVAGLVIAWSLFRYRLLDLVPIGRAMLLERMPDGMIVLDEKGRPVDINAEARLMLGLEAGPLCAAAVQASLPGFSELCDKTEESEAEITLQPGKLELDVRMVPLFDPHGRLQGRLLILHDITARMADARERERIIAELRQALAQIKTLRGLLPICCSCKKIRNDQGYWEQIESYIYEHAGVAFSHGLCPDCSQALYGEDGSDSSTALTP